MHKLTRIFCLALLALLLFPSYARPQAAAEAKLDAEKLEQSGVVITIIFDDSGSMEGRKLAEAKAAFRDWIASVPADYRLSLIALNAGMLVKPSRGNAREVSEAVNRIQAGGNTPLAENIGRALGQIQERRAKVGPYERQILIVFTDGQDTSTEGVTGVARRLNKAREINVETVGIGFAGEGDYMSGAATRYYNASDRTQLRASLAKADAEIGDTSDIVIDEPTLALMRAAKGRAVAEALVAQKAATAVEAPTPEPVSVPPQTNKPSPVKGVLIAAIVILTFRALINGIRKTKSR